MDIQAFEVSPHDAEKEIAKYDTFSSVKVVIDGHEISVMIYANGPTSYQNHVLRHVLAMPIVRIVTPEPRHD